MAENAYDTGLKHYLLGTKKSMQSLWDSFFIVPDQSSRCMAFAVLKQYAVEAKTAHDKGFLTDFEYNAQLLIPRIVWRISAKILKREMSEVESALRTQKVSK